MFFLHERDLRNLMGQWPTSRFAFAREEGVRSAREGTSTCQTSQAWSRACSPELSRLPAALRCFRPGLWHAVRSFWRGEHLSDMASQSTTFKDRVSTLSVQPPQGCRLRAAVQGYARSEDPSGCESQHAYSHCWPRGLASMCNGFARELKVHA